MLVANLLIGHYQQNQTEYDQYKASNSVSSAYSTIVKPQSEQVSSNRSGEYSQKAIDEAIDRSLQRADHLAQIDMTLYAFLGLVVGVLGIALIAATLKYTRDAANAAADTLKVAQDTLKATQDASRNELQPYVSIPEASCEIIESFRERKFIVRTLAVFANSGQTPAFGLRYEVDFACFDTELNQFSPPTMGFKIPNSTYGENIGSQEARHVNSNGNGMPQFGIDAFKGGRLRLVVTVRVAFGDIYNSTITEQRSFISDVFDGAFSDSRALRPFNLSADAVNNGFISLMSVKSAVPDSYNPDTDPYS